MYFRILEISHSHSFKGNATTFYQISQQLDPVDGLKVELIHRHYELRLVCTNQAFLEAHHGDKTHTVFLDSWTANFTEELKSLAAFIYPGRHMICISIREEYLLFTKAHSQICQQPCVNKLHEGLHQTWKAST